MYIIQRKTLLSVTKGWAKSCCAIQRARDANQRSLTSKTTPMHKMPLCLENLQQKKYTRNSDTVASNHHRLHEEVSVLVREIVCIDLCGISFINRQAPTKWLKYLAVTKNSCRFAE